MGILDKAKEKAGRLAEQAKDKIDDVKEKRKVDELLDELGRIVYRQRTEHGEASDETEIVRLVGELKTLEAEGTAVLAPAPAPVEAEGTAVPAPASAPVEAEPSPPPPPPPADAGAFPEPE